MVVALVNTSIVILLLFLSLLFIFFCCRLRAGKLFQNITDTSHKEGDSINYYPDDNGNPDCDSDDDSYNRREYQGEEQQEYLCPAEEEIQKVVVKNTNKKSTKKNNNNKNNNNNNNKENQVPSNFQEDLPAPVHVEAQDETYKQGIPYIC